MFWVTLDMSDHTHLKWLNEFVHLLIPYHMQETSFITQLILDIKLTHYLSSVWASPGMPETTNYYLLLLWNSSHIQKFNLIPKIVQYWSLKNPAFVLVLRFLDHNSRTRFFPNKLFLQKVKRPLAFLYWYKKHIWMDKIFEKILKTSFLGHFWDFLSPLKQSFVSKCLIRNCRRMEKQTMSNL